MHFNRDFFMLSSDGALSDQRQIGPQSKMAAPEQW